MARSPALLILTALVAATIFISPWQRDLYIGDEVRYGQVIREMRQTGDLLVPHLNGEPYSHKPPLHFWVIYGLTRLGLEDSIWPFVLPSQLAFLGLLLVVRRLGDELAGEGCGDLAMFITATFYLAWGLAQTARMDVSFVLMISLAVLWLHRFLMGGTQRDLLLAGAATGIAVLIKGPMAFVIVAVLLLFERFRRGRFPEGRYWLAFLIAAVIPLIWLVPAIMSGGEAYAREILVEQNAGRAIGSWTHREPPWFYILHAPATFFPWFAMIAASLLALFRPGSAEDRITDDGLRFCVSWFLAVLIPFSIISGKLDVYMLPACVPLAILIAGFIVRYEGGRWSRFAFAGNLVTMALIGLLGIALLAAAPHIRPETPELKLVSSPGVQGLFGLMVAASFAGMLATWKPRDQPLLRSSVTLALVALAPMVYIMFVLIPVANHFGSTEALVRTLERQEVGGEKIVLFKAPYLWSREMPETLIGSRHVGEDELGEAWKHPPSLVVVQGDRAHLLGERLGEYVRVDRVRIKAKDFDVYRRR